MFDSNELYQRNLDAVAQRVLASMRPPAQLTVTQWAELNRILSAENCAIPGPYRVAITPFIKEPLDSVTDPLVEVLVMMKSAQVAWTDGVVNNVVGYYIHHDPTSILILFPTENMAKRYSKEKLKPMIRDTEVLRGRVADAKSRDSDNTILSKNYRGGHLELVGSNSPVNLASSPIKIVIVEEPDRCAANSGGEGDSIKLAIERTKTFDDRKIIMGGSPTIENDSQIEREMELSDKRRYNVPCPDCNGMQILEWSKVIWDKSYGRNHPIFDDYVPETARYKCECGYEWSNAVKNKQLHKGEWIPTAEFNGTRGYYISELYSPFPKATLAHMAKKFLEANKDRRAGDNRLYITVANTSFGETFAEKGESVSSRDIKDRVEDYGQDFIPPKILTITAAVDVQDDRLECEIVGWGHDYESWSLDYIVMPGDPESRPKDEPWKSLEKIRSRVFTRSDTDVKIRIACVCIDSGDHTNAVYRYVWPRQAGRVYAIKGKSTTGEGDPIVGKPSKKSLMKGLKLYPIGTDTAKTVHLGRMGVQEHGPGFCHFPRHYTDEFFKQITGEKRVKRFTRGRMRYVYVKKKGVQAVEALDIRVYNLAALDILNPDFNTIDKKLKARESKENSLKKEINQSSVQRRRKKATSRNYVKDY